MTFKITLTKSQVEILQKMRGGCTLKLVTGLDSHYSLMDSFDFSRVKPSTVEALERKRMIEIDDSVKDWRYRKYRLTERGEEYLADHPE